MKTAENGNPIRILIVDDQILFANSLKLVINHHGGGRFRVVGVVYSGSACLDFLRSEETDFILMDVRMPEMDGVETAELVHARYPDIKIMMLTTFEDDTYASRALGAGAMGYVIKNIEPEELILFIESVNRGTMIVSPSVGKKIFMNPSAPVANRPPEVAEEKEYLMKLNYLRIRFPELKKREAEVLYMILKSMSNQQIADKLFIAEQTVRNYSSSIYAKIGVDDRLHAIQLLSDIH